MTASSHSNGQTGGLYPQPNPCQPNYANIYLHLSRKLVYLAQILMPNARQKILKYILDQQASTVEELSRVFRVTPANIRHHLSILTEQGSIKVIGQKTTKERGRPCQVYASCQQSERNNLDRLSDALLSTLAVTNESAESNQQVDDIARHISSQFKTGFNNPTRRLYSAIHSLNRMNYQAHWEAHLDYPRVMFGHCPYQAILASHPELCRLDVALLEDLLESPVRQVEKFKLDDKGLPKCVFLVNRQIP